MGYYIYLGENAVLGGIQISGLLMIMQDVNYEISILPLKEYQSPVIILSLQMLKLQFFCLKFLI